LGKEALKIDHRLKELMRAYNWPGNVRELEHMLAGALALVQDENIIGLEHISDHYVQAFNKAFMAMRSGGGHIAAARPEFPPPFESPLEAEHGRNESIESVVIRRLKQEEKHLRQCLAECQGNLTQAAKQMSISRQLLSYRLLKHGLDYRDYRKTRS
jgi:arginine utilization regulatory protein